MLNHGFETPFIEPPVNGRGNSLFRHKVAYERSVRVEMKLRTKKGREICNISEVAYKLRQDRALYQ